MKKIVLTFVLLTAFLNCSNNSDDEAQPEAEVTEDYTIVGRWHLVGFEDSVMYQFTDTKRHTIYSTDGSFGGIETAIPSPNDWVYEEEKIVIDLNFGNFLSVTPNYRCDGNVVDLVTDDGEVNSTLFRENFDMSTCN